MISIDTIKFSLSYPISDSYKIKVGEIEHGNLIIRIRTISPHEYFIEISKKDDINIDAFNNKNDSNYFSIYLKKKGSKENLYMKAIVTVHLNKYLFRSFNDDYYINQEDIFNEIYSILESSLNIDRVKERVIVFKEVHVSKDVALNHDVSYYMKVLKYNSINNYYSYQKNHNRTITIHKFSDFRRLTDNKYKNNNLACIYDKSNKLYQEYQRKPSSNILRFEYKFTDRQKRDIGITKNKFYLSDLYKLDWQNIMLKYLFSRYLKTEYLDKSQGDLQNRQDTSQENTYNENTHIADTYYYDRGWANSKKVERRIRYKFNRFYEVNFKKYLKKDFKKINSSGLRLYKELCEKVLNNNSDKNIKGIPNIYKIYLD